MQTTSATWESLWQSGSARLEARATIAGTVYTDISAPVIARALMQEGLSAGNAVSASCALSLRAPGQIPKAATVLVEQRLTDGETASEWLPAGTFYVSRRSRDPVTGRLSLECYDALLKANAVWEPSAGAWPRSMTGVAAELAALIGVTQDPRNALDSALALPEPAAGATVRDALGAVAAAHGGNWIITPAGLLRLVPLLGSGDSVAALGVLGRMDAGEAAPITGVRCAAESETFLSGDETGAVVTLNGGLPAWAATLQEDWEDETWQRFELSGAVYDPAAELGDNLTAGALGEVDGVLCGETVTLGALFKGDVRAPGPEELADEYPYIGAAAKTLAVAKAYAQNVSAEAAQALNNALTQLEIFNRLTGNGAAQGLYLVNGQLYVNASYIHSGALSLGGANNENGALQIYDADGNVIGVWDKDGVIINSGLISDGQGRCSWNLQTGAIQLYNMLFNSSGMHKTTENTVNRSALDINIDGVTLTQESRVGSSGTAMGSLRPDELNLSRKPAGATNRLYGVTSLDTGTTSTDDYPAGALYIRVHSLFASDARGLLIHSYNSARFPGGGVEVIGSLAAGNGASGTFTTADGKTVTVVKGIITAIS